MKTLHYTKPHNLGALHAELLAAIPTLRPVAGPDTVLQAVASVQDRGNEVYVIVPDAVADADVAAVIAAHTNPPPPDTTPPDYGADAADLSDYTALRQWVTLSRGYVANGSPTAADTIAQVKRNTRAILAILRRLT